MKHHVADATIAAEQVFYNQLGRGQHLKQDKPATLLKKLAKRTN